MEMTEKETCEFDSDCTEWRYTSSCFHTDSRKHPEKKLCEHLNKSDQTGGWYEIMKFYLSNHSPISTMGVGQRHLRSEDQLKPAR